MSPQSPRADCPSPSIGINSLLSLASLQVLKGCKKLNLSVHSVGRIPGGYVTNHIYTWVDPQGRSVSPPMGLPHHQHSSLHKDSEKRSHLQLLQEGDEKKVSKGDQPQPSGSVWLPMTVLVPTFFVPFMLFICVILASVGIAHLSIRIYQILVFSLAL